MSGYDLVIRGGTIVEGGRLPAYRADLAISDGVIACISGNIRGSAERELDASGCIVAPGAIDLHCHDDAQIQWDPPTGLRYTLVNGVPTFVDNECTGALPGQLLRSGDMVG